MQKVILEKDTVLLTDEKGNRILLQVNDGIRKIKSLGVYNPKELIGKNYYEHIDIGNRRFLIMEPSILDMISTLERKAQIILPKDGVFIIFYCNLKSGDTVIEGGSGSGALTLLLANYVKPHGRVISYEIRDEFAKIAKRNVECAGLEKYVDFCHGDVTEEISEKNADAVVLDIPNPWDAIENAQNSLKLGGHLATYSPTMNQVEKTVKIMRKQGFIGIKSLETIQREIAVVEKGVRPSFDTLGHTGYITIARRIA
jgi:tRNA (adenine57-N1/adenine58-N1)-methyltransferase